MCFSATASFAASAVLFTIGVISEKRATSVAQRIFSSIPLIFAAQQFNEGLLWLGMEHSSLDSLQQPAMYAFMLFAQVVWPVMIPLSILLLEHNAKRKNILLVFLASGIMAAAYLLYCIVHYGITAKIECYHINYRQHMPDLAMRYGGVFYLAPIIIAPFFSSIKKLRWFGILIILSYAIAEYFYTEYLASVWCFFAAIISVVILMIISDLNKKVDHAVSSVSK